MIYKEYAADKFFMGRFPYDSDLLEELQKICSHNNIRSGSISLIGAVKKAVVGYFDQNSLEYINIELKDDSGSPNMEILTATGNISVRDGKSFIHVHILLSDRNGRVYGGHLMPNTIVFACEFVIQTLKGPELAREFDETTSLYLWKE